MFLVSPASRSWLSAAVITSFLLAPSAQAGFSFDRAKTVYLGAGALTTNLLRVAGTPEGGTSFISTPQITLGLMLDFKRVAPTVSYTIFTRTTSDDALKVSYLTVALPFQVKVSDELNAKAGAGILFQMMKGEGGTVVLNNGTGTSTFAKPDRSVTSRLLFLDFGVGYQVTPRLRGDFDAYVTGVLSTRRALNLLAQASYGVF